MRSNADFLAYVQGRGQSFNKYAAGRKKYMGGKNAPNTGPTADLGGYRKRDATAAAKKAAMLRRLKAIQKGNYMSSAYLSPRK